MTQLYYCFLFLESVEGIIQIQSGKKVHDVETTCLHMVKGLILNGFAVGEIAKLYYAAVTTSIHQSDGEKS